MLSLFKKKKTIATHNGSFHADDIFAVAALCLAFENKYRLKIIRTRDQEKIEQADFVVDVGGAYDPDKNRFDHHQSGGAGTRENGIPYASFGLVWKKYGEMICASKTVADKIDKKLVTSIDAVDNGVEVSKPVFKDIYEYTVGDMFSVYKTTWKEDRSRLYERFLHSVLVAKEILQREARKTNDREDAKNLILDIYKNEESKSLLIFNKYYPFDVAMSEMLETFLIVFPDSFNNNWCIEVVRKDENSFESKILFPENWAGKSGEMLEKATGVKGAVFCHKGRFFAVTKTKEAAIALAAIALKR